MRELRQGATSAHILKVPNFEEPGAVHWVGRIKLKQLSAIMATTNIQKWCGELWLLVVKHYQLANTASWVNKMDYFRSLSTIYWRFSAWAGTWFARMFSEIRVRFHGDPCSKLIWKTRLRFNTKVACIHKFIINLYFSSGWDLKVIIWGFQWVWSNWNQFPTRYIKPALEISVLAEWQLACEQRRISGCRFSASEK